MPLNTRHIELFFVYALIHNANTNGTQKQRFVKNNAKITWWNVPRLVCWSTTFAVPRPHRFHAVVHGDKTNKSEQYAFPTQTFCQHRQTENDRFQLNSALRWSKQRNGYKHLPRRSPWAKFADQPGFELPVFKMEQNAVSRVCRFDPVPVDSAAEVENVLHTQRGIRMAVRTKEDATRTRQP